MRIGARCPDVEVLGDVPDPGREVAHLRMVIKMVGQASRLPGLLVDAMRPHPALPVVVDMPPPGYEGVRRRSPHSNPTQENNAATPPEMSAKATTASSHGV